MALSERVLRFEGESTNVETNPSFGHIAAALRTISPRGPSFFTLSDDSNSYVQAAGAKLRLTLEYRHTSRFGFRHYVLGVADRPETPTSINYSGGAITLQTNEILALPSAMEVFETFHRTGQIPDRFVLRETTSKFA